MFQAPDLTLTRSYLPHCTAGIVSHQGEQLCVTLELPWLNNQPNISCVVEGVYTLSLHHSPTHGACLALSAASLGVTIAGPSLRSHCLIHKANAASQLQGCIAPGLKFGCLDVGHGMEWAVLQSTAALAELIHLVDALGGTAMLEITH